ncbi:MAG: hypothetical protein ACKPE1_15800, partial [Dolichospermum sp.]
MLPPASSIRVSYQQQHYRRDHIIIISAMFSLGLMNAGVVQAQSIISQIPTRPTLTTPEPPLPTPQPIEEPKLETPPSPVTPSPLENVPGTVNIKGFEFIGNTAFTQEKLRSAVNDLI